ncbi:hypothetical protein SESBI_19669 [Sesbania bispinosa]|nr:hypothetical protein SESBI_19669 [Sesbania bispinosa]
MLNFVSLILLRILRPMRWWWDVFYQQEYQKPKKLKFDCAEATVAPNIAVNFFCSTTPNMLKKKMSWMGLYLNHRMIR